VNCLEDVRRVLGDTLQLGARTNAFNTSTPLLGSLPELDSMAVVAVITAIEEHFGFTVHDDEISAETFQTLGSLVEFVEQKLS
jgi:acyl carrier protein